VLQHPTTVLAETSMKRKSFAGLQNSGTETQVQQVLSHLHGQSLGEPTCQVCNEPIGEAEEITPYLYKPAGSSTYSIGQCRDHATHQTWPMLIGPPLRLRSTPDTTTGRVPPEPSATDQSGAATLNRPPIAESGK